MRYFLADEVAYEAARHSLNVAWGLPNPGTVTALPAAETLLKVDGRVLFCVDKWMCALEPALAMIDAALASGDLLEITEAEYVAVCQAAHPDP